jgi:membrane protein
LAYRALVSERPRLATAARLALAAFHRHNASRFGAALAFYVVFTIAPLLLIAIAALGSVFGRELAQRELLARVGASFGSATAAAVAAMIADAAPLRAGWLATVIAATSLYFGVSGVYRQIADALQTIWHERPHNKAVSMLLVSAAGLVLLCSVLADAAIAVTGTYASSRLIGGEWLWHSMQLIVSALVLTMLFGTVFRYLTPARVTWRNVRPGAATTAILFVIGKFALGIYLGKAAVGSAFGAAGSIIVVLLWAYWSAQIFFFGLEFTHVYAQERGQ